MTQLLGLPLETAVKILENDGYNVELVETRSLKGVEKADARRVIRIKQLPDRGVPMVQLVYSEFRTKISIG